MSVIDIAKTHFESLGVQSIEVPEWKDENGNATILYWNPINLSEKNTLFKKSDNLNDVSILADIVVMKSLDKDGKKVFKAEDKLALMYKVDSDVLSRISSAMVKAITPDQVKKKLQNNIELKNLLIVADRLKITLSELLKMEVWEYNHWLGFMLLEQEETQAEITKSKHR